MSGGELNGDFFENVFDGVVCEEAFFYIFLYISFTFFFSTFVCSMLVPKFIFHFILQEWKWAGLV